MRAAVENGIFSIRTNRIFEFFRTVNRANIPDSPRSREVSTKVGVDGALRNMGCQAGFNNAKTTFMGVDNAGVCLSVVLINIKPHERDLVL